MTYVQTLWDTPSMLRNVSAMSVNALYQPWRGILSMINMCLTGKTAGYDRPKTFTFLTNRENLAMDARVQAPKPTATQPPIPKPAPTQPSKAVSEKKRKLVKETPDEPSPAKRSKGGLVTKKRKPKSPLKLVDEPSNEGVPVEEPAYNEEDADLERALELSLMEQGAQTQGPARPVVIREPESGRIQPLPEVQGKGKEKVVEEQAAHDLLTLQTPTKKSLADQFIFQRRPPMPTESSAHAESPSMDAELNLTDSETESDVEASKINAGSQDEGQAGPNPGEQDEGQAGPNPGTLDEGQAGSNPGDTAGSQPPPSHVVHAGPNLEHMDLETTDASTQHKPEQMDEGFTTTAYPNVQENLKLPTEDQVILEEPASSTRTLSSLQNLDKDLSFTDQFFVEKPHEENAGKTNVEIEVQLMVSVPIHQDTSSVPPMTTLVIDLTTMQSDSLLPTSTATTSIITTTITIPPTPPPQQSNKDSIFVYRIGKLEQHMADLLQDNLALGESQAVDEIVADAVDWAMQASLQAHFRDLPTVDMKEILQQRMFGDNSYKANNVYKDLYEALQKSLELDYSNQRAYVTPGTLGASGSSQLPPPPPPPSTGTSGSTPQQGSEAPSSSKTTASAQQSMAWTTSDTRYKNDHTTAAADSRKDWWKPLPGEEISATPEPAWTIPSSHKADLENNWASALATTYEPPSENSLLAKIGDMTTFLNSYCQRINKIVLTQADFKGHAYEVVKAFYPDVIYLQFQMEECHKMLTDRVDWANSEGDQGSCLALSISKMKAASYLNFGLELLVPEQIWIDDVYTYDILNVVRIKAYSQYIYDYLSEIVLRRADHQEHKIAEKDFKNLYPSDFEDLNLLLLQGHIDHLSDSDKKMLSTAIKLWTRRT
ncbi:retrovirus-related pol polyprotein from transposon TNT 1-94 [Tanacetum coccineum]